MDASLTEGSSHPESTSCPALLLPQNATLIGLLKHSLSISGHEGATDTESLQVQTTDCCCVSALSLQKSIAGTFRTIADTALEQPAVDWLYPADRDHDRFGLRESCLRI